MFLTIDSNCCNCICATASDKLLENFETRALFSEVKNIKLCYKELGIMEAHIKSLSNLN